MRVGHIVTMCAPRLLEESRKMTGRGKNVVAAKKEIKDQIEETRVRINENGIV